MSTLAPDRGALRARLDESCWAQVADRAGLPAELGLVAAMAPEPLPDEAVEPSLVDAARLLATAPLRVEASTSSGGDGLVAELGWDGTTGVVVVRAVASADGRAEPAPGVEVSVFPADRLVRELVRLFPPSRTPAAPGAPAASGAPADNGTVVLAPEVALAAVRALRRADTDLPGEISASHGWPQVPELLVDVAHGVRGQAVLALRIACARSVQVRSWLQVDQGWLALSLAGQDLTHRMLSAEALDTDLTHWVSGAIAALREAER